MQFSLVFTKIFPCLSFPLQGNFSEQMVTPHGNSVININSILLYPPVHLLILNIYSGIICVWPQQTFWICNWFLQKPTKYALQSYGQLAYHPHNFHWLPYATCYYTCLQELMAITRVRVGTHLHLSMMCISNAYYLATQLKASHCQMMLKDLTEWYTASCLACTKFNGNHDVLVLQLLPSVFAISIPKSYSSMHCRFSDQQHTVYLNFR